LNKLLHLKTKIRAADAKEVGVGNPAEETCCHPNVPNVTVLSRFVNRVIEKFSFFPMNQALPLTFFA
jgi:hypothetical protein